MQWLEKDGYTPAKLVLKNNTTGEEEEVILSEQETSVADEDVDRLNMILYLKDKHNISGITCNNIVKYVY